MILEVEMINWRAFDRRAFTFKPGLNFILGPNGRGKTSILEAIAYALTGEPSVVTERDQLLRDPGKPATVRLTFQVDGKKYRIERTQAPGRAGDAYLIDVLTNKSLAAHHNNVTEKIEELTGVPADFLQRIVYMAEGDVYRFLKTPPGKAMNQQVQRVLGLTQLDELQTAIKAAKKDLRDRSKDLKSLQGRIDGLHIVQGQSLESMIGYLDQHKSALMTQILENQAELTRFQQESDSLVGLDTVIKDRWGSYTVGPAYVEQLETRPLVEFYHQLLTQIETWRAEQQGLENEQARLVGQKDSLLRVLQILSDTGDLPAGTPCPVCKKPMSPGERHNVIAETQSELARIDQEVGGLRQQASLLQANIAEGRAITDKLSEIRSLILHGHFREIDPSLSLPQIQKIAGQSQEDPGQAERKERIKLIQNQVDELDGAQANFIAIRNQLQADGFANKEEVQEALVQSEIRQLTLTAAGLAAEATLAELRDGSLGSIYTQIAAIWDNFIQNGHWQLRFDPDGNPVLVEQTEREFDFEQFSGGEKTALLVIIHTAIAHYFSRGSFLMIDEPLEHLDPVNRRSLMRFFMAACKNRFFDQALITTYEESLVRKYISDEQVNVVHIR